MPSPELRRHTRPIRILKRALNEAEATLGNSRARRRKRRDMARTARGLFDVREHRRRLRRLQDEGRIETLPNEWQLAEGSYRMLIDFIIPISANFYGQSGKNFFWQQVLRILDEPSALMDPTGLAASKRMIISHLVQVAHHEAGYDVGMLRLFPGGIEGLRTEVQQLVDGTHPRQAGIEAIVERPDYHARLLEALDRYIADPVAEERLEIFEPPDEFRHEAEEAWQRFGTPERLFRYCATLPDSPAKAAKLLVRNPRLFARTALASS